MKIFIDFDDVLFNTGEFSRHLKNFFELNGVSKELFQKYYYDANDKNKIKLFDPEGLFLRLEKYEKIDSNKLKYDFYKMINELSKFVFPDVESFLKNIGRENIYLVSFGLPDFQNEKIVACGIHKMVAGCIVTKGSKAQAVQKLMEKVKIDASEKLIFIDDRVEQVQEIKKEYPKFKTIFLCRKEGRYCDEKNEYCDYRAENLNEVQKIIFKLGSFRKEN